MLTRRHIRTKVMQCIFATKHSNNEGIDKEVSFLNQSMHNMFDLFIINLNLLSAVHSKAGNYYKIVKTKHLASDEDKNPKLNFVKNKLLLKIRNSTSLEKINHEKKLNIWGFDDEYPALLWDELRESDIYQTYIAKEETSFDEDKAFVIEMFETIIAPNQKLYEYFEDHKLTWIDDLPIVNTNLVRFLKFIPHFAKDLRFPELFKNEDDRDFALELLKKTLLNEEEFSKDVVANTQNWDKDRIANLDYIMLIMACAEFTRFPSIPVKVTINEYLEISKDYSTPKSSTFINGLLDKIVRQYKTENRINKVGRGLIE